MWSTAGAGNVYDPWCTVTLCGGMCSGLLFCVPTDTAQFFTSTVAVGALFETLMAFVVADAPPEVVASIEQFHSRRQAFGIYWAEEN